jgi:hypothetical protein
MVVLLGDNQVFGYRVVELENRVVELENRVVELVSRVVELVSRVVELENSRGVCDLYSHRVYNNSSSLVWFARCFDR